MKIVLVPRQKEHLSLGLVYGGIGIFALAGLRLFSQVTALFPHCPFHRLTGIPCPTCGATRCSILLSQFRVWDAFLINPLFVTACLGIAGWAVSALALLVMQRRIRFDFAHEVKPILRILVMCCIVLNWAYLVLVDV